MRRTGRDAHDAVTVRRGAFFQRTAVRARHPGYRDDGRIDEHGFGPQFDQAVATLERMPLDAGGSMRGILKMNMLLTRAEDVADLNRRHAAVFAPLLCPAHTAPVVAALPDWRMPIEIRVRRNHFRKGKA